MDSSHLHQQSNVFGLASFLEGSSSVLSQHCMSEEMCVPLSMLTARQAGHDMTSSNTRGHDDDCIWSDLSYPTCGALTEDANLASLLF